MAQAKPIDKGLQTQRRTAVTNAFEQNAEKPSRTNVGNVERVLSVVGGGALSYYGLQRKDWQRVALLALSADLVFRGVSGFCWAYALLGINTATKAGDRNQTTVVQRTVTVNRSVDDLYNAWRDAEKQPQFALNLESVTKTGGNRSHWVAKIAGKTLQWDSEQTDDTANHTITWKSLSGGDLGVAGEAIFTALPVDRGTEVFVRMSYDLPAGKLGALAATFIGANPDQQLRETTRRFKELMETGEIATTIGQPTGHGTKKAGLYK